MYFYLLIILFFVQNIQAEFIESYNNTRSLGMGGAMIGLTSDETSLYRNPANLGSIRGYFGTALDPELEGSANYTDVNSISNVTRSTDLEAVGPVMSLNPDMYYHSRFQATPNITMRNYGIGLIYRSELSVHSASGSALTMDTQYYNDLGFIVGANESFFGGVLKLGFSVKAINRIEVVSSTLTTSGTLGLNNIGSEGSGISYTAGLMVQIPVAYIPTLSLVIHDVGDTQFNFKDGVRLRTASQPATVKQTVDAAFSLFPIHSSQVRSTFTVEYRDLQNVHLDTSTSKRLHVGMEFNIRDILFVRGGLNQGFWTAGVEVNSEKYTWQISTYGEDVGAIDQSKEERRYASRFVLRF